MEQLLPAINAQNETLKTFTETQNSALKQLSESMKSLTNHLTGNFEEVAQSEMHDVAHDNQADHNPPNEDEISAIMASLKQDKQNHEDVESDHLVSEDVKLLLQEIQAPTEFGKPLTATTASTFQSISKFSSTKECFDVWKQMYKTPENCNDLVVPTVNNEIWAGLPMSSKTSDAAMQGLQHHLLRAQIAQARVMDQLFSSVDKEKLPLVLKPLLDSAKSISLAMQDINQKRKMKLRPNIKPEYSALCSGRVPVGKYLFGDNLEQSLKEVKATATILRPQGHSGFSRFHPYRLASNRGGTLNFNRPSQFQRGGQAFQNQRGRFQAQRGRRPFTCPFQRQRM